MEEVTPPPAVVEALADLFMDLRLDGPAAEGWAYQDTARHYARIILDRWLAGIRTTLRPADASGGGEGEPTCRDCGLTREQIDWGWHSAPYAPTRSVTPLEGPDTRIDRIKAALSMNREYDSAVDRLVDIERIAYGPLATPAPGEAPE